MSRRHMNYIKKDRYREAYERINAAISSDFNLEAIVIVESILSNRISSFLVSIEAIKKNTNHQNFSRLIELWKAAVHPGCLWEECSDLIDRVDNWRKVRNECIHGFVKFPHNEAKVVSTIKFLEKAKKAATVGRELSVEVYYWRNRQIEIKRKHSKSVANSAPLDR